MKRLPKQHSIFALCVAMLLSTGALFAQSIPNAGFDLGNFSNGTPPATNATINSTVTYGDSTLGGTGQGHEFNTSIGTTVDSWGKAMNGSGYVVWFNTGNNTATGDPDSLNRFLWLNGNEVCLLNNVTGLTGNTTYKICARIAGFNGTVNPSFTLGGSLPDSFTVNTAGFALELNNTQAGNITVLNGGTLLPNVGGGGYDYASYLATTQTDLTPAAGPVVINWQDACATFTTKPGVTSVQFYISSIKPGFAGNNTSDNSSLTNGVFVDSITIAPVPEPTSGVLLLSTLAFLGSRRRRKTLV